MRICGKCGHRNWKVTKTKVQKCEECNNELKGVYGCNPMLGHNDGDGSFHKQKIIDSDNIIDQGKKGN
jgi:hypothetical protein